MTDNLFPFMLKSTGGVVDFNTIVESGFYRLAGGSYVNAPSGSLYGVLIVFKDSSSYCTQIVIDSILTDTAWFRGVVHSKGEFRPWKKITSSAI